MTDNQMVLRNAICGEYLILAISDDRDRIFAEIDSFVAMSQGNDTLKNVDLFPYDFDSGNYNLWNKVGQGVGNLKSLRILSVRLNSVEIADWKLLARILPYIQNKIELKIIGGSIRGTEDMRAFARAIQGHPAITRFVARFFFENTTTLCSALATLPNLESVVLDGLGREEVPTFQSPESMTEFLRAPSLRIVKFRYSCFASSVCQAIAMSLRHGSSITSLEFLQCSFPEGGSEEIASALKENATLTTFQISSVPGVISQAFYDAMSASMLSNSTLQKLSITDTGASYPNSISVSSLLLAVGMNQTLRKLRVSGYISVGASLIPALREGLGKNYTLKILELIHVADAMAPSFHFAVVEALQLNKTLKTLRLYDGHPQLTNDEVKHLTSVIKKNYGLESISAFVLDDRLGDLRSILRLNGAGREYLLDGQGSVVSKGVGVLSAVSDDLNCVFLHLLENPSLCNSSH
jgi:hypothetical protein